MKRAICIGAIATVIFGAGFVASDVLSTRRLTVTNDAGKAVVVARADRAGNGELVVYDASATSTLVISGLDSPYDVEITGSDQVAGVVPRAVDLL